MQGTRVRALVQEAPTCHRAIKPTHHNYWACEPQLLSPRATTTEARTPRARALQQEKPPQWEARAHRNEDPMQPKIKKKKDKIKSRECDICMLNVLMRMAVFKTYVRDRGGKKLH